MGYYNNWILVVHSEEEKDLIEFEDWLKLKVAGECNTIFDSLKSFTFISANKQINLSYPLKKSYVTYAHSAMKWRDNWEVTVDLIGKYCNEHKLEWEYVRSGEDLTDIEIRGEYTDKFIDVEISWVFNF